MTDDADRYDVVVVGAGFGGVHAVSGLRGTDLHCLLVDRHNYHTFQPLLYQVATAGLGAEDIAHAVRDVFKHQDNVEFAMNTVVDVEFDRRRVVMQDGSEVEYRYLVLAVGASTHYFGVEGAEDHAFEIKNLANAVRLRSRILRQFEYASRNPDRIDPGTLTFVIVGGGPTGVETAGALMELFDNVLRLDYSDELVDRARVILLEMLPNLLDPYVPELQQYTRQQLEERGVDVRLETTVEKISEDRVFLEDQSSVPTQTLIWAAGVKANPLAGELDLEQVGGGRIKVDDTLAVPKWDRVYVIGDMSGATDEAGDRLPQLAPVAIQQGTYVANRIKSLESGGPTRPFRYRDPGQMATIGRHAAVVELSEDFTITGYVAWVFWVFLHIAKLIGFRNKLAVFLSWVYNYFTYGSSSRLILEVDPETDELPRDRQRSRSEYHDSQE